MSLLSRLRRTVGRRPSDLLGKGQELAAPGDDGLVRRCEQLWLDLPERTLTSASFAASAVIERLPRLQL